MFNYFRLLLVILQAINPKLILEIISYFKLFLDIQNYSTLSYFQLLYVIINRRWKHVMGGLGGNLGSFMTCA
jgi:hypothetical protein